MFGIYRLSLAIFVLISHTKGPFWIGHYGVFNFFILSGFLMTLVLKETYGYNNTGIIRYYKNRWLRIYPTYYAALIFTIISAFIAIYINPEIQLLPQKTMDWIFNFSILGLTNDKSRLIGAAWSLHVEIIYYLAIPFLTKRDKYILIWLFFSLGYTVWGLMNCLPFQERYFSVLSASLPFSIGASLYCFSIKVKLESKYLFLGALFIWLCNIFSNKFIFSYAYVDTFNFYLNTLLAGLVIYSLYHFKPNEVFSKLDKKCGEYCYPIFLLHGSTVILGTEILGLSLFSYQLMFFSLLVTFPLSFLSIHFIDKNINQKRSKIRGTTKR